jgi:hypothetical protein
MDCAAAKISLASALKASPKQQQQQQTQTSNINILHIPFFFCHLPSSSSSQPRRSFILIELISFAMASRRSSTSIRRRRSC